MEFKQNNRKVKKEMNTGLISAASTLSAHYTVFGVAWTASTYIKYYVLYEALKLQKKINVPKKEFVAHAVNKRVERTFLRPRDYDMKHALDMHRWFNEALENGLWDEKEITKYIMEKYWEYLFGEEEEVL